MTATKLPPLLRTSLDYLTDEVTRYSETRLCIVSRYHSLEVPKQFGPAWTRSYLRDCSRQLKCPFVLVEIDKEGNNFQADISFRKMKRTEPLASGLLVGAYEVASRWQQDKFAKNAEIIRVTRRKTIYDFIITNETRFKDWVKLCATNEHYRVALGLPRQVQPNPLRMGLGTEGNWV